MTTSKRVAERKVAKFEKNITRRGLAGVTSTKNKFTLDNIVIAFCIFVIVGSFVFQIIKLAILVE
ncbi:hypothetical protein LguiA_015195 [Lonicera macranthoides]